MSFAPTTRLRLPSARFPRWHGIDSRDVGGEERPAHTVVSSRWHEVEVHHVDLGMGYRPQDWPDDLVDSWLPEAREHFLPTADQRELLAWLVGRGSAPRIIPWG